MLSGRQGLLNGILLCITDSGFNGIWLDGKLSMAGSLPKDWDGHLGFIVHFMFSPWVISALFAAFLSFPVWVIALTKLDISYAYSLTSLSFVSVVFMGWFFFGETLSIAPVRELWLPKKAGQ